MLRPNGQFDVCALIVKTYSRHASKTLSAFEFGQVPELDRRIRPAGAADQGLTIRREGQGFDTRDMAGEDLSHLPGRRIPEPDGLILVSRSENLAVRREDG